GTSQVAERPVVGDDVEAVVDAFERTSWAMTPVLSIADVRTEQLYARVRSERADAGQDLVVGQVRERVTDGGEELVLGLGIEVGEGDRRPWLGLSSAEHPVDELRGIGTGLGQVLAPGDTALGTVDAHHERGDDLA